MNMYQQFFYASFFGVFFNLISSLMMKRRRPHELRNEIYVPSLIDFELKGKSLAWFPVQIKNGGIESVGKLRWKKHRKCRYVEEANCLKTGKPKRVYNAQEDEDDPDAGDGRDEGEVAYDDYDYYDDDDDNSTSNPDWNEYESSVTTLTEITVSGTTTEETQRSIGDEPSIIEDNLQPTITTEGPLTDETEEVIERKVPVPVRGHCRNRQHTYYNKMVEATKDITNLESSARTGSPDHPTESSTYKVQTGDLTSEPSREATTIISTTIGKIKYYTDDFDVGVSEKSTAENAIKSTNDIIVSDTSSTPKVGPVAGDSEIYDLSTIKKSSSDTVVPGTATSKSNERTETYPETFHSESTPRRLEVLSTLKYSNTVPAIGAVSNRLTIDAVDILPTNEESMTSRTKNYFKYRTKCVVVTKATQGGGDYYNDDEPYSKHTRKHYCDEDKTVPSNDLTDPRLRHIETPPYPKPPVNLRFPTCSGNEDKLDDILSPTFVPGKQNGTDEGKDGKKDSGTAFEKKKEKGRKNRKHCRRKSTYLTTEMLSSKTVTSLTTERYIAKQRAGNKNDAKVVVRIPSSLSDIPVVVMRDPLTQKLSLSLIGAEQDSIHTKPVYYKPRLYHQMFPPPFSYNNLYSPNIPPFRKIYPYEYLYGPNVAYRYDKANYIYPKRLRFCNNYRWIRDTYEDEDGDDEEDDKNSTNSEWEIYLTV